MAALNSLCGEASLLAKNPELQNVTKYCIEGSDMLRSIADFRAAFCQDTAAGTVFRDFVGSELIVMAMEIRRGSKQPRSSRRPIDES